MIKIIRHKKLCNRELVRTKIPMVRFFCESCDCVFEANGDDFKINGMTGGTDKPLSYYLETRCPDCNKTVVRRYMEK